ncbi:MAG TPA: PilN domain-containing protein [Candidatus Competibacter sp.]|nr:PilN domain-containing protein [Candidatus Competibacter sp.]
MLSHMQALRIAPRWRWDAIWHWWRDGLLAWLPASLRRWLGGASRRLVVAVDDRECVLLCEETDRTRELERLDRLAPDWNAVAGWFKAEKPCQLVLRFPTSQALIRTLSLPSATEKNLRQVAGFEMDRLTPFAAAQVYYDATVLERQPEQRRLRVELVAVPRSGVEPVLAQLRQRDLQPDALEVAGGRPGLNLLPPEQRGHRDLWVRRLRGVLIVATLLLVAVAAILPIWQQRALVLGTMAKASRLQQAANQALALRDQLDRTLEASRMLAQKKQTVPTRVDVLRELTSILPDDTWLERLQIKGDTAQLIGQSAKASALVGAVESSKLFNGAGFASPVTTDPRTGKERFVLGARIGKEL